jgi:hypothetical protein
MHVSLHYESCEMLQHQIGASRRWQPIAPLGLKSTTSGGCSFSRSREGLLTPTIESLSLPSAVLQALRGFSSVGTGFCLMMLRYTMVALDTRQATALKAVRVDLSVDSPGNTGWLAARRLSLAPSDATPLLGRSWSCVHAPRSWWLGLEAAIDISPLAVKCDGK